MVRSVVRRPSAVAWLVFVFLNAAVGAAPGDLDPGFASGGRYLSTLYGTSMFGPSVAVQPGGRILVAGKHFNGSDDDFALLALTAAGGFEGSVIVPFTGGKNENAKSILLLGDGRIVMGGEGNAGTYAQHGVVRLLANGSLDGAFGVGGRVSIDFGRLSHLHGMARQTDGKLVVVGDSYSGSNTGRVAIARLNVNGSLDASFGTAGRVDASYGESSNGHAVVIGTDDRITIGGYVENATNGLASACFVARFSASGQTDTGFGSGGSTVATLGSGNTNYCHQLVMQTDGKVVMAGGSLRNGVGDFVMARYTTTGALDASFGSGGVVSTEFGGRLPSSTVLPDYFSPGTAVTQQVSGYTARVYANGMAVGVKDGRVYVYGDVFGGLRDVGALTSLLAQAFQAGY